MASLTTCINRAGKALDAADAKELRTRYGEILAAGAQNPAEKAVAEYLEDLAAERNSLIARIEDKGGRVRAGVRLRVDRDSQIAKEISAVPLLDGDEELEIDGDSTAANLAEALVKRTRKANRGRALNSRTARTKRILSDALAAETEAAINRSGHAGTWYSHTLENAVALVSEMHPELSGDADQRSAFLLGLSITSQGLDVASNANAAEQVYKHFKRAGRFPEKGFGDKAPVMAEAFAKANQMIDKWGLSNFTRFLNTEFTVAELNQMGFKISGELAGHKTHGSAVFGPKIGGGFYQNLMGNFSPLTMDRWFMRTWGRLVGDLLPSPSEIPAGQANRLREAVTENPRAVEDLGFDPLEAVSDDKMLVELAKALHRSYAKSGFKDKTELHKAGKNLDLALHAPIIAPRSGAERAWIREVSDAALEKLRARGVDINAASMQALVWYPEKDLYIKYGVGNAKSSPTDYEQEFAKIAAEQGVDEQRIAAIRARPADERPAERARAGGRDAGEAAVEGGADAGYVGQARQQLLHKTITQRVREQFARPFRSSVPKGRDRFVVGADTVATYKPEIKVKNAYNTVGLATPVIHELKPGEQSAAAFHKAITKAKKASKAGAAVYVYSAEEYESMRTFLTEDGLAGFALKGDDIVSVFKHPKSKDAGVAQALISLAVQEGGRRLDAFDTVLPTIYSMQGFKVVARVAWNEEYAPAGWNKNTFNDFNGGEPDVVYMVYDRNLQTGYTGQQEGEMVADPDAAVALQDQALLDLAERNVPEVRLALPKKTKERIDDAPDNPLSQFSKVGATVEEQVNHSPISGTRLRGILDRSTDLTAQAVVKLVPRRYLNDFLPNVKSVSNYLRLANRMSGYRNEMMTEYEETARKWADWGKKNKRTNGVLSNLMHASTLAGVDPSKPYKGLKKAESMSEADKRVDAIRRAQHLEMKQLYDNMLDDTARELYNEVRDSYTAMRRRIEVGLKWRIRHSGAPGKTKRQLMAQLRKQFEAGRVAGPYFPLMRYGDRWAVAKDPKTGDVVSFSRFENRADHRQWISEFREAGYDVTGGQRSASEREMAAQIDPNFVSKITKLVGESEDPGLADQVWSAYLQSLPELSIRKQYIHRKGRMGFAADALRAYANVSFRNAHQSAKIWYMHRMYDALRDLKREVDEIENQENQDDPAIEWAMPLYNEMVERHKAAENPNAAPWSVKSTALGFAWYLGFTPAAAAINLSQTPLVALPVLSAEFNALGASKELGTAIGQYTKNKLDMESSLRGDEYRAFQEAKRIGLFEKTQAHDLAGVTETGAEAFGSMAHRVQEASALLFHKAEQANRQVTFMAAYRLARQRGQDHESAIMLAEDLTWDSHFDYSNDNRPRFMQSNWGRVITLFKQYSLNMSYRMARDFRDGVMRNKAIPLEERNKARTRFVGMMTMAWLMAGISGLPTLGVGAVKLAAEALLYDDDEPKDAEDEFRAYLAEWLGPDAADVIIKGPTDHLSRATVSDRVSLGNLWWRDPGVNDEDDAWYIAKELAGPLVGLAVEGAHGAAALVQGDTTYVERGIERITPKVVRDVLRAHRYATEGAVTQHVPQDILVAKEEFSGWDIALQGLGFSPARLTKQYEQNAAVRRYSENLDDIRQKRVDALALAMFNEDKEGVKQAWEKINKFNETNPQVAIGPGVGASMQSRLKRHSMSRGGVSLDQRMMYIHDQLSFFGEERAPEGEEE